MLRPGGEVAIEEAIRAEVAGSAALDGPELDAEVASAEAGCQAVAFIVQSISKLAKQQRKLSPTYQHVTNHRALASEHQESERRQPASAFHLEQAALQRGKQFTVPAALQSDGVQD